MRRPIDCRLRIGSQSSDPQPTIVRTPAPRFLDWRLRRSSEHKCRRVFASTHGNGKPSRDLVALPFNLDNLRKVMTGIVQRPNSSCCAI